MIVLFIIAVGGFDIPLVLSCIPILRKFITSRRRTQHALDMIKNVT